MKAGSPIEPLAASVHKACLLDLAPMEHEEYEFIRTPGQPGTKKVPTGRMKQVRPDPYHISVVMFEQTWGSTALGFGGIGGQAITGAYTIIVEGPMGDACVYFHGRLAYRIERPNAQFRQDIADGRMHQVAGAKARYEMPLQQGGV
jgi:hypothetical protein